MGAFQIIAGWWKCQRRRFTVASFSIAHMKHRHKMKCIQHNPLNLVVSDAQKCMDLFTNYFELKYTETKGDTDGSNNFI